MMETDQRQEMVSKKDVLQDNMTEADIHYTQTLPTLRKRVAQILLAVKERAQKVKP